MVASMALPPSLKMSRPACAASELGATTAPRLPKMGFIGVSKRVRRFALPRER